MNIEKLEELALQAAVNALVAPGSGLGLSTKDRLELALLRGAECHGFVQNFKYGYMIAKGECQKAGDEA